MKKFLTLVVAIALVATVGVNVASAQSSSIDALIPLLKSLDAATLSSLLRALGAAPAGAPAAAGEFTTDMGVGAKGAQVEALQQVLIDEGYLAIAAPTGTFGPLTKSAVIKFQAANGINQTGFVGPLTRAALNDLAAPVATPVTTGTATPTAGSDTLSGGAGSVNEYTLVSSVSNEDVGEGEDDVDVIALDVEADDNSDLRLTAVRVVFNEGTAASDFEDYAKDVSVTFDGKEVASVDADEFTSDNAWTKTISLASGAVIKAGETERLAVRVSGIGNLDSNDANDTWTADINQVRYVDASGASTSEDPATATRTFTFKSFANAADVELKISSGDSAINDARVIDIDATNDTDNVELLSFKMKAQGDSDIRVTAMPVSLTAVGVTNISQIVNTLYLYMNGEEIGSETVTASTTADTVLFDDVDFTIKAGETANFVVKGQIEDAEGTFGNGDTLAVSFGEAATDMTDFVAKDESRTALGDDDKTGSATGNAHSFFTGGIRVSLVGTPTATSNNDDGNDDDTGTFVIKYRVEAFGSDAYVSANPAATAITTAFPDSFLTTTGVVYYVDNAGVATVAGVDATIDQTDVTGDVTAASTLTNAWLIEEGEVSDFTLTIRRTNTSTNPLDDGQFKAVLKGIGWSAADNEPMEFIYTSDLGDFKTTNVVLD